MPSQFSLRNLLAVVACCGVLLAIITPAFRSAREASRRIQCVNNLKEIGLGVHNFHDNNNGLPPLSVGAGRGSCFVLIDPYVSGGNGMLFHGGNQNRNAFAWQRFDGPNGNWSRLTPQEQNDAASVRVYRCPSRERPAVARVINEDNQFFGPVGDYAVVFFDGRADKMVNPTRFRPSKAWQDHYDPCLPLHVQRQRGLLRLANINCRADEPDFRGWKPRDTFARCTDGTSNTILIGEKFLHAAEKGRHSASPDEQDGTFLFEADNWRMYHVARNSRFPWRTANRIGNSLQNATASPRSDFRFGGWHDGVVLFVRGDASVYALSVETDADLRFRFSHPQDGLTNDASDFGDPDIGDDAP
jgi:hypothetical protein